MIDKVDGSYLVVIRQLQPSSNVLGATNTSYFLPGTVNTNAEMGSVSNVYSSTSKQSANRMIRKELLKQQMAAHWPLSLQDNEVDDANRDFINGLLHLASEFSDLNNYLDSSIRKPNIEGLELRIASSEKTLSSANQTMNIFIKEIHGPADSTDRGSLYITQETNIRSVTILEYIILTSAECEAKIKKLSAFNKLGYQNEDNIVKEETSAIPSTSCCALM